MRRVVLHAASVLLLLLSGAPASRVVHAHPVRQLSALPDDERRMHGAERPRRHITGMVGTSGVEPPERTGQRAVDPIVPLARVPDADAATLDARRTRLFDLVGNRVAVMVGAPSLTREQEFAQDNNFRYLTGVTAPNAALVLDGRTRIARLYLPVRTAMQRLWEGAELEPGTEATRVTGIDSVFSRAALMTDLTRMLAGADTILVPFGPPEWSPSSAFDANAAWAVTRRDPLLQWDHYHAALRERLGAQHAGATMVDLTPLIFRLRWIKDAQEIAALRRAASLAVIGLEEAIRSTAPGRDEADLAVAAAIASRLHGADDVAFPPVMATGPHVNVMHHTRLGRRLRSGDLLLLDYGSRSNGYMSDITRTWPASGRFTPEQARIYESLAMARDSLLAAIRPGVRPSELVAVGRRVLRQRGDTAGAWLISNGYLGHPVGMSTHDPWGRGADAPWEVGVVYNIEPVIDLPERGWHFRIEDTIVVTATGADVLTAAAPIRITDLVRLREETGIYERLVAGPGASR